MSYFKWVQWYELLIKTRRIGHICLLIFYASVFKITAILILWLFTPFAKRFAIIYWKLNLAANAQLYLYKPTLLNPLCVLVLRKTLKTQMSKNTCWCSTSLSILTASQSSNWDLTGSVVYIAIFSTLFCENFQAQVLFWNVTKC